jgi:putative membrane protein
MPPTEGNVSAFCRRAYGRRWYACQAPLVRFERTTPNLGCWCSILLSYRGEWRDYNMAGWGKQGGEGRSMPRFLLRWGINTIALYVAVEVLPGLEHTGSGAALIGVALIFGLVNAALKPVLFVLSCPLVALTFGLFLLVINGLLLLITAWVSNLFDLGFKVQDLGWGILGAIVIGLVSWFLNSLIAEDRRRERA